MKSEVEEEAGMAYIEVGLYTSIGVAELRKTAQMFSQYIWSSEVRF